MDEEKRPHYESEDGRYEKPKNEEAKSLAESMAKAGIAIGAAVGATAVAYRSGAVHKAARFLDVDGRAAIRAFKKTKSTRPLRESIFSKNVRDEFRKNRKVEKRKIAQERKDGKPSKEFSVERDLRRVREYVGDLGSNKTSPLMEAIDDSARSAEIHRRVTESGSKELRENFHKFQESINKMDIGRLRVSKDSDIEKFLKKEGIESDSLIKEFNKIRGDIGRKNLVYSDEATMEAYKTLKKKIMNEAVDRIVETSKKEIGVLKGIKGGRQATVNDMLEMHKNGIRKLDEVTKRSLEKAKAMNEDFGDTIYDKNLRIRGKGEKARLEDTSVFGEINRAHLEYWAGSMPGGILHIRNYLNVKDAEEGITIRTMKRGSIQSGINAYLGKESTDPLDRHLVYVKGKIYDAFKNENVNNVSSPLEALNKDRDILLTSSRHGSLARMYRGMSGTLSPEEDRGLFGKLFDVGRQDNDSIYGRVKSFFFKFDDDNWGRNNIINTLDFGARGSDDVYDIVKLLRDSSSEGLSDRSLKALSKDLSADIQEIINRDSFSLTNKNSVEELFNVIGKREMDKVASNANPTFLNTYRDYLRAPDDFYLKKRTVGELSPLFKTPTKLVTGEDLMRQEISSYLIDQSMRSRVSSDLRGTSIEEVVAGYNSIRADFKEMFIKGEITKEEFKNSTRILDYSQVTRVDSSLSSGGKEYSYMSFNRMLDQDQELTDSLAGLARQKHSLVETYNMNPYENLVGDDFLAISKSKIGDNLGNIFDATGEVSILDRFKSVGGIVREMTAGRGNMEDVSLATMVPFYTGYRLQEMLSQIGLGMSDSSMKSAFSMYTNLFAKRVMPAYLGYEGFKYADWKLDEWTGRGITERYEDLKAEDRLLRAHEMTDQERYELLKEQQLRPGLEHFDAMPSMFFPVIGEVNPLGMLTNTAVSLGSGAGYTSYDEKDTYTVTETYENLFYGVEEVRKSKWWLAGSKSAYRGDRITEFAPNSWRLAHSDWEYSGVGLTGEEYWSHHLLPTLENPLGGLSFALGLRDPYYFEKKHYEDRPYMLTGELFNPGTPILGDFGNATIGRLIKPVKKMHKEYWNETPEEYQYSEYAQVYENSPLLFESKVNGDIDFYKEMSGTSYEEKAYFKLSDYLGDNLIFHAGNRVMGDQVEYDGEYLVLGRDEDRRLSGTPNLRELDSNLSHFVYSLDEEDESEFDYYLDYQRFLKHGDSAESFIQRTEDSLFDLNTVRTGYQYKEEYTYDKYYDQMLLDNVIDPRSKEWRSQEFKENITEPLGVYKWIIGDEVLDIENYQNKMVIERADKAYNASEEFWESNLGSLGGAYSEMARRFIRRESGQLESYNPIRNTMPDWLPGEDYFTNFLIGDPYSKIEHGERRLPGAGYESLHELHPDEFGMYGAFDRFKILADVAPWSEEYKFWSDYVLANETDEDLRKEAARIRKQASAIKQKFDFQDYRFRGNDITYKSVTVDKIVDDFTFTTKEFGDNQIIRLAGVDYVNRDTGLLEQFIQEGSRVEIGIATDETQRYSNDTYGSMKAVLRDRKANINKMIIDSGMAAESMNDFSAPGVHARFDESEIAQGSRWEAIAHAPTMINTKLLPVRTAVEEYERDQIYGRDWATWEDFMFRDYLIPAVEGLGRHSNPLWSIAAGATTGAVTSALLLPSGKSRVIGTAAGAALGVIQWGNDKLTRLFTGEANLPQRRRDEAVINEYYDFLKYIKYSALYEKSKEEYEEKHKVDLDKYFEEIEEIEEEMKEKKKGAQNLKRWYYINRPDNYEDKITLYNKVEEVLSQDLGEGIDNEELAKVMYYKDMRDQTVFGLDPLGMSREDIMKALPYKDSYFFNEFIDANKKDRKKILELIPENQRRIYKSIWSGENIEGPDIDDMLRKYHIPDADWDGWKPEYNLDDIKMKTVAEKEDLDLTDFGFWETDLYKGDFVPELNERGGNSIYKPQKSRAELQAEVKRILRGEGLENVDVTVNTTIDPSNNFELDYTLDRQQEIEERMGESLRDL